MVYLNRIYTRSGDTGETSLGDQTRVKKTHPRIAASGGTDELNAVLGVVLAAKLPNDDWVDWLTQVQNDLFDLGADLCVPETEEPPEHPPLRVTTEQVTKLEGWIDAINDSLSELTSFVLPGGTMAAAQLHHARTVCRRVELTVLHIATEAPINDQISIYLNRLSDLLFVMARACNDYGQADVLWVPGKNR